MPTTTGKATDFITFSRASLATLTDSDGKIKWVPHNLIDASESFSASVWAKTTATITANSFAAPNGATNADTITATAANATVLDAYTADAVPYTFGVWLRRKTGTGTIEIAADSGTWVSQTITSSWALYTVTQTPTAGSKSAGIRIGTSGDEIYAWGAHVYRADLGGMQANTSAYPTYNPSRPRNLLGFTELLTTGWTVTNGTRTASTELNPNDIAASVDLAATAANATLLASVSLLAIPYTFSIWLKRKTGTGNIQLTVDGTTYVTVTVTSTWTRFSTTLTPTAGTVTPGIRIVTSGDAVYAWGAQLSDSASLDPYIANTGAAPAAGPNYGPRLDYDSVTKAAKGLLVEEQRTNLVTYSNTITNAAWVKTGSTVAASALVSPTGAADAYKLTEDTGNSFHIIDQSITYTAAAYTISAYVKKTERDYVFLQENSAGSPRRSFFNISTGSLGTVAAGHTATITDVGNGWYRCTITFTATAIVNSYRFGVSNADNNPLYQGDGTSGVALCNLQCELGSFATSYIPTTSATVTRSADVASVATSAFPYSSTEGTIVVNADYIGTSSSISWLYSMHDGTTSNRVYQYYTGTAVNSLINSNSVAVYSPFVANNTARDTPFKSALAYKASGSNVALKGTLGTDSGAIAMPAAATIIKLGQNGFDSAYLNGHIRQITYLPRRLSNAELVSRTS